uniref:RRM domain-containing protein n=1 Tax=Quercus lobata TaxID=97700 RepID=A0A7N2M010_QUELO
MTTRIAPGVGANLLGQHSAERNQDATAYVGNLDPQVSEELLWELFVQAGPVVNVYVPKDRVTNLHQGYGFVEFRSEEDADYAIKVLNMIKLYGKPIRVNKASQDKKSLDVGANLFIGNLDPDVDEKLLYDTFSAFGVIVTNPKVYSLFYLHSFMHFMRSWGSFETYPQCSKLWGKWCITFCSSSGTTMTHVLGERTGCEPLLTLKWVPISSCLSLHGTRIMRDPESGNSRGFGFISYDSFEASDAAIEAMNGQYLCNRQITVSYAYKKDTKGERHGTPAERVLAASNPTAQKSRPHTLFASGPPTLSNVPQSNGTMPPRPFANGTVAPGPIPAFRPPPPPQGAAFPPMPVVGQPPWQVQPQQPGQTIPPPMMHQVQQFRPAPPNMPPPPPQAGQAPPRPLPPPMGMGGQPPMWRPPPPPPLQQQPGRPLMPQSSMPPPPPPNNPNNPPMPSS